MLIVICKKSENLNMANNMILVSTHKNLWLQKYIHLNGKCLRHTIKQKQSDYKTRGIILLLSGFLKTGKIPLLFFIIILL